MSQEQETPEPTDGSVPSISRVMALPLPPDPPRSAMKRLENLPEREWVEADWRDLLIAMRWAQHRVIARHGLFAP